MANREVVALARWKRIVARAPADELAGLRETAHLLRSRKNAQRLLSALSRTKVAKDRGGNALSDRRWR